MLDQYRQEQQDDAADLLSEDRFRMSRQKLLFLLFGSSLLLLSFLFMLGTFRSDTPSASAPVTEQGQEIRELRLALDNVERRLNRLEGLSPAARQENSSMNELGSMPVVLLPEADTFAFSDAPTPAADQVATSQAVTDRALGQMIGQEAAVDPQPVVAQAATELAPAAPASSKTYVVQKGDTLSQISMKLYGTPNRWRSIYDLNRDRIPNVNKLKVGTALMLPPDNRTS